LFEESIFAISMLKGISPVISSELLKILADMGHGDELVIADSNFPASSHAQRLARAEGSGGVELLDAILRLLPLDTFVERPVALMSVVPGDDYRPAVWGAYRRVIRKHEPRFRGFEKLSRSDFYDRARRSFAVVASGETSRYANLIIKKGLI
jgi:L-fucose mutarotase